MPGHTGNPCWLFSMFGHKIDKFNIMWFKNFVVFPRSSQSCWSMFRGWCRSCQEATGRGVECTWTHWWRWKPSVTSLLCWYVYYNLNLALVVLRITTANYQIIVISYTEYFYIFFLLDKINQWKISFKLPATGPEHVIQKARNFFDWIVTSDILICNLQH